MTWLCKNVFGIGELLKFHYVFCFCKKKRPKGYTGEGVQHYSCAGQYYLGNVMRFFLMPVTVYQQQKRVGWGVNNQTGV